MRILIVEDHVDSARATQLMLRRYGYNVDIALNAERARSLCASEHFDLLLCDIGLPDSDGWELMATLREQCGIKGIAVSGRAFPDDIARSIKAGFSAHVNKPFEIKNLLDSIEKASKS